MIKAEIVADSIGPHGIRITSFFLTYPRFIHAELMTHRAFSRNAASSRAIPLKKMIERVKEEPAMPIHWGAEQKGMQSGDSLTGQALEKAKQYWLNAASDAMHWASAMGEIGLHKSVANRVLEPFAHMGTLVTATDFVNFFNLRAHPEAQPEFQELAYQMLDLWHDNKPKSLTFGEWHLPYADKLIEESAPIENKLKISTARAARTSYLTMNNEIDPQEDYKLHDRLCNSKHWSPFEHPAKCEREQRHFGNFRGWMPYRKMFPRENMTELTAVRRQKPA